MDEKTVEVSTIKKCRACFKEVEPRAKKCHLCGTDQRSWFARHKIITGLLIIILLPIVIGSFSNSMNKVNNVNSNQNSNQVQAPVMLNNLGDEGYLRLPDISDPTQLIILTETQSEYTEVTKALLAKDWAGLLEIPGAFSVSNGTKVKIIDTAMGLRKVRVMEAINEAEQDRVNWSGWTAMEYVVDR